MKQDLVFIEDTLMRLDNLSLSVHDSLRGVFTPKVIERMSKHTQPSNHLKYRLEVLTASGPYPKDIDEKYHLMALRAQKAAWEAYLDAALTFDFFSGSHGKDFNARLTGTDDANFRGAMAEAMTAYYLHSVFGFSISPRPQGQSNKTLEFIASKGSLTLHVEVKSPYSELPQQNHVVWGDDSDLLSQLMKRANSQFDKGVHNLLVIVPNIKFSLFRHREPLIKAFYGQRKLVFEVDTLSGNPISEVGVDFFPDGHFLNPIKRDRSPGYTRIAAVLCIEEQFRDPKPYICDTAQVYHKGMILFNPFATKPIPEDSFEGLIQFGRYDNVMRWSDNC